jgi:hypothetical protein
MNDHERLLAIFAILQSEAEEKRNANGEIIGYTAHLNVKEFRELYELADVRGKA